VKSIHDLTTPALLVDADALSHNLEAMARALPGNRMRPHVKAHKCTLARGLTPHRP
jgi:D-serine deaminase-like pyridoxal phosphate-dependent protein